MVDYVAGTGTSGSLIIRDTGSVVYAIIKCTNPSTFANGVGWSVTLGGGSASGTFNISGNQEVVVWSGNVGSTANMTLNMGATGTSGLGGPASVGATIQRATVPGAPVPISCAPVTMTSILYRFGGTTDGGAAIDQWQIGYGTDPNSPQYFVGSGGTTEVGGLSPGTTWYFWSRGHNAVGWGPWSARAQATTYAGSKVKVSGVWKNAVAWVKVSGVWKRAQPWVRLGGNWKRTI